MPAGTGPSLVLSDTQPPHPPSARPRQVCATLAQCGELFLQLPGVSASPLLGRALGGEDAASDDLLFDAGREADAWKVRAAFPEGEMGEVVSRNGLQGR